MKLLCLLLFPTDSELCELSSCPLCSIFMAWTHCAGGAVPKENEWKCDEFLFSDRERSGFRYVGSWSIVIYFPFCSLSSTRYVVTEKQQYVLCMPAMTSQCGAVLVCPPWLLGVPYRLMLRLSQVEPVRLAKGWVFLVPWRHEHDWRSFIELFCSESLSSGFLYVQNMTSDRCISSRRPLTEYNNKII